MKKKRIIKLCCFCLVFLLLLGGTAKFLKVNSLADGMRLKGFYMEPENSLDMVVIGASETYTSIAPGILWKKYGFTSYLYSVAGCPISMVKSQIKEVRSRQDPKVIVVEINGAVPEENEYQRREGAIRNYLDNIPWSENKAEAIKEVIPEEEQSSYFFPFLKYHSNWKNLKICVGNLYMSAKMRISGGSKLKGFQTISRRKKIDNLVDVKNDHSTAPLSRDAEYYLRDLLQYLKDEKIDNVLFIRIPHSTTERLYGDYQRTNRAGEIIEEYGYPFANFEYEREKIGLDPEKDFYNDNHMNLYGQKKFTKYFGKYLTSHYDLKDSRHSEKEKKAWDETAKETEECMKYAKKLIKQKKRRTLNEGWRESKRFHLNY